MLADGQLGTRFGKIEPGRCHAASVIAAVCQEQQHIFHELTVAFTIAVVEDAVNLRRFYAAASPSRSCRLWNQKRARRPLLTA